MSPKKVYGLPPNLTFDKQSGRYRYRWTATGKKTWIGRDRDLAIEKANRLNAAAKLERNMRVRGVVDPSFASVIDAYIESEIPRMPWSELTKTNTLAGLQLYRTEMGALPLRLVDRLVLAKWIENRGGSGGAKRRHRLRFVRLYDFAISRKWCDYNEAQAIPRYSRSKKLSENKILRKRMSLDQFWRIHDVAPLYMQVAMQMSLVTLQGRQEILNMQRSDIRDGHIHVVRKKTAAESDNAFIRIPVSSEIDRILTMSRSSGIASPYIVHRLPRSRQPHDKTDWPHPTWVRPQRFTVNFSYIRDKVGITAEYEKRQAPTFHEIRSLGARLMRERGVSDDIIQTLLAHGSLKTSEIYLDGRDHIADERYITVQAPLKIER